jgi:hypothetical protein
MGNTNSANQQQYTNQQQYLQQLQHQIKLNKSEIQNMRLQKINDPNLYNQHQHMNALTNKNKQRRFDIEKTINENNKKLAQINELLLRHKHIMTQSQFNKVIEMKKTMELSNNILLEQLSEVSKFKNELHQKINSISPAVSSMSSFNIGTTAIDYNSKALERRDQLDNVNILQSHYGNDEDREIAEFEMEERKRRKAFMEQQKRRRQEYQSKLQELDNDNINALKLFGLHKNYSIEELKVAYKKIAIKTHPDRKGGSNQKFQLVTKCYMSLLEKYKNRESDRTHMDLRSGSKTYIDSQTKNTVPAVQGSKLLDKDKFDVNLFNKLYDDNKLWDPNEQGYGGWFEDKNADASEETPLFSKKFNLNIFNSTFESYKTKHGDNQIVEYNEPRELVSTVSGYTELDNTRDINDFTKPMDNGGNNLGYTDLKTAYTDKGAFINPNEVEYKTYNSIDELKRDRSQIAYTMTPEQIKEIELKKMQQKYAEDERQHRITQRDGMIANTYNKSHMMILGHKPTNDF